MIQSEWKPSKSMETVFGRIVLIGRAESEIIVRHDGGRWPVASC